MSASALDPLSDEPFRLEQGEADDDQTQENCERSEHEFSEPVCAEKITAAKEWAYAETDDRKPCNDCDDAVKKNPADQC